jgi:ABC-type Fe3+-hydroxamate transport system substrate-binding protein
LGDSLVAITDYCIHPEEQLKNLPRIGGTKNPDIGAIVELAPDLVFANQEENTPAAVHALEDAGVPVHLSFPKTLDATLAMLADIADLYADDSARQRVEDLTADVAAARMQPVKTISVFMPIWEGQSGATAWWMTVNQDTFTHDLLAAAGFANVFAQRERRYPLAADLGTAAAQDPGGRDTRYPRVTRDEILAAAPDVILLPSEPYEYGDEDIERVDQALAATPAAANKQIYTIDGTLVTWTGTRIGQALPALRQFHSSVSFGPELLS